MEREIISSQAMKFHLFNSTWKTILPHFLRNLKIWRGARGSSLLRRQRSGGSIQGQPRQIVFKTLPQKYPTQGW
jgi:hypothetical protein